MAEFKTLSLSQAAQFDWDNGLRSKETGWGKISRERREKGISRKEVRKRKKAEEQN